MSAHSSAPSVATTQPPTTDFFSAPPPPMATTTLQATAYRPQFEAYDNSSEIIFTEAVSATRDGGAQTVAPNGQCITMNVSIPDRMQRAFEQRRMMLKKVTWKPVVHQGFSHPFYVNLHAATKASKDMNGKWTPLSKLDTPNAPPGIPAIYGYNAKHGTKLFYGDQAIAVKGRSYLPDEEHLDMISTTCSGPDTPGRTLWQLPNAFDKSLLETLDGLFSKHITELKNCISLTQKDNLEKMQAPIQGGQQEMTVIPKDTLLGTILEGYLDTNINNKVYNAIDSWCFTLLDRNVHFYEDYSSGKRAVSDELLRAIFCMRKTMCQLLQQFMGFTYGVDLVLSPPVFDNTTFKDVAAANTVPKVSVHLVTLHFIDLGPKPQVVG